MNKQAHALITGASSGIGMAIAREYARRGKPTVLIARRQDRLQQLSAELSQSAPSIYYVADLSKSNAAAEIHAYLQKQSIHIDTLVNNAGYGVPGRYLSSDWQTHSDFIEVLLRSVCELTHRFLPAMEAQGHGRILNIASLAGLTPASAGHTLYGASKAFLIRFSESLALEVASKGIHVTALCPGFTYSEFHDVNGMRARVSALPKMLWLSSEDVAKMAVDAVESGRHRLITGKINRLIAFIAKYLPDNLARALVASKAKNFRDQN